MPTAELTFITDFADQAVILPVLAVVAIVLSFQRRWRVLGAWLCAGGAVLATIMVLKVACYSCAWLLPALGPDLGDLRSPSGHGASAAMAYGGLAALTVGSRAPALWTALAAGLLATAIIGTTRVELGAHSVSEVVLGAVVGILGALAFVLLAGQRITAEPGGPVLLAAALAMLVMHGRHLPAEAVIQQTGVVLMRRLVPACDPARSGAHARLTPASAAAALQ